MVLDFKVNKGWAQRSPFFMPIRFLELFQSVDFQYLSTYDTYIEHGDEQQQYPAGQQAGE